MADPQGGWIKLHRSMKTRGHLKMPDVAFKVWIYFLLQVNFQPGEGCQVGEGWITYDMIRQNCCDDTKPPWADSTINRALDFLEDNGYIKRLKSKTRGPHRIRVINYRKYQGDSSSDTQEPSLEPVLEPPQESLQVASLESMQESTQVAALGKQEGIRMPKKEEVVVEDGKAACLSFLNGKCLNWQAKTDGYMELLSFGERITWPVVERAARNAVAANKGLGYCLGTLRNWEKAGVRNIDDAKLEEERFRNRNSPVVSTETRGSTPQYEEEETTRILREELRRQREHNGIQ